MGFPLTNMVMLASTTSKKATHGYSIQLTGSYAIKINISQPESQPGPIELSIELHTSN